MKIEIKTEQDDNFKIVTQEEKVVERPQEEKVVERPQPTLENPKGHSWFNGTSWGLK